MTKYDDNNNRKEDGTLQGDKYSHSTFSDLPELEMPPRLMSVAMLRRELMIRGINITGGKNELVKSLEQQTGFIDNSSSDKVGDYEYIPVPDTVETISDLNHLRMSDLKNALKERGLKSSGKKSELQFRLLDNIVAQYRLKSDEVA